MLLSPKLISYSSPFVKETFQLWYLQKSSGEKHEVKVLFTFTFFTHSTAWHHSSFNFLSWLQIFSHLSTRRRRIPRSLLFMHIFVKKADCYECFHSVKEGSSKFHSRTPSSLHSSAVMNEWAIAKATIPHKIYLIKMTFSFWWSG